jgi:radical SAM family uncharacterized protein/radical SAM-linked protein
MSLERPGRYLGTELNALPNLVPDGSGRLLKVALCFPDVYEIAFSHLGHKILYGLFNSTPGFSAERAYAPWVDLEAYLRGKGIPLASLESRTPLGDFGVLGFSLQYELGYTGILNMLELSGIPLRAKDRGDRHPLVVAGGPGASNPEPMSAFFDFFFLGDAEANLIEDYSIIKEWRFSGEPKEALFQALLGREGIYIPSLYRPLYGRPRRGGAALAPFEGVEPLGGAPFPKAAKVRDLDKSYFPCSQIVPFVKPVHDRVAVEIARGCTRGCRFCQAGYLYRPVREREKDGILGVMAQNLAATGQDEAAFLALSAGDHSQIADLVGSFMDMFAARKVSLSLPSLRVRSVNRRLAENILRVRKTGFTIAPEAATARLRRVINKDLTEEDILRAAELSRSLGWRTLKLYFMCGLPTETEEDLDAIAGLSLRLGKAVKGKLNVGLAHFTPKAHTPFQWHGGSTLKEIRDRLDFVRDRARGRGINIKYQDPGVSLAEALVARGDRRMGDVIEKVFLKGARFEAWSDRFRLALWEEALEEAGLPLGALLEAPSEDAPLPWDHLSYGVTKDFLRAELSRAMNCESSPDCREAGCLGCGACRDGVGIALAAPLEFRRLALQTNNADIPPEGPILDNEGFNIGKDTPNFVKEDVIIGKAGNKAFSTDRPSLYNEGDINTPREGDRSDNESNILKAQENSKNHQDNEEIILAASQPKALAHNQPKAQEKDQPKAQAQSQAKAKNKPQQLPPSHDYVMSFRKEGASVYLGHLELMEVFKRAFRKAGIPLAYSHGFHPQPRLSFLSALPLGVASQDECLPFALKEPVPPGLIRDALVFPEGIAVNQVARRPAGSPKPRLRGASWLITAEAPCWEGEAPFAGGILSYPDKNGRTRAFDLSTHVIGCVASNPKSLTLDILQGENGAPNPARTARFLWGLPEGTPLTVAKLKTLLRDASKGNEAQGKEALDSPPLTGKAP